MLPHQGTWRDAASYREALEFHTPLLAFSPTLGTGRANLAAPPPGTNTRLADAMSFAEVRPASVVLSSLRPVDSDYVRLDRSREGQRLLAV